MGRERKKELTMSAVQNVLWDEINNLRNGKTSALNLQVITNASSKILLAEAMRIRLAELTGQKIEGGILLLDKK